MLTALGVKIVSSGNGAIETCIAREVMAEWNAAHAWADHKAILPVPDGAGFGAADLLLVFFAPGSERDGAVLEAGRTIEAHLRAGHPVLIYFSEPRTELQAALLRELAGAEPRRGRFGACASVDTFGDEKEFRAKFGRQLDLLVRAENVGGATPIFEEAPPRPKIELSAKARAILVEACDDPEAYIGHVREGAALKIQANGRQLVEPAASAEAVTAWEQAFAELLARGLVREAGCNGRLYQISAEGFDHLRTLGKSPVGYIPELSGI